MMKADCSQLDIIVLTYNRAKQLSVMLESLCNQTARGFHIIVLNNASTDNTLEVIKQFQSEYPSRDIQVVTNTKNLGNFGNFKKSQKIAKNTYTAVLCDDDAIHPEYIETAMELLVEHSDAVLCSGGLAEYYNVSCDNWCGLHKDYYLYPKEAGAYCQLHVRRHSFQNIIYKTEIYKKAQYRPEKYGKLHDIIFLMEASRMGPSIFILGECSRVNIGPMRDSCQLENGPFPDEIYHVIQRINELTSGEMYAKPALWNFAYFLYLWSELPRFETWSAFCDRMRKTVFTDAEIKTFSWKVNMDELNGKMAQHAAMMCNVDGIFHTYKVTTRSGVHI